MRENAGQAKTDLSKLLGRVHPPALGAQFLAAYGTLADAISIADDVELTDAEIDELLDVDVLDPRT